MFDSEWDWVSIEPDVDRPGGVAVYGHGEYPDDSVNAGMPRRVFLDCFDSAELAREKYPDAQDEVGSTKQPHVMSEAPPAWFDPTAAGESW